MINGKMVMKSIKKSPASDSDWNKLVFVIEVWYFFNNQLR